MRRLIMMALLCASSVALGATHPTKAQGAYFSEHAKCVSALGAARKQAKSAPKEQRKQLLEAARAAYQQCESHAYAVWKAWPKEPAATAPR